MLSVTIVVMVVLGGSGSVTGVIRAAVVLTWLPEQWRFLHEWRMVIYSLLLIILMITRPQGLLGSTAALKVWRGRKRGKTKPSQTQPSEAKATLSEHKNDSSMGEEKPL